MSLVQKTYGSFLQILAINDEHVFPSKPRPKSSRRRAEIKDRVHDFLKDRWSEIDGGWAFKVFEDPDNVVTDSRSSFFLAQVGQAGADAGSSLLR